MAEQYVFDQSGINALTEYIKTTRSMADSNGSAIDDLETTVPGKQDKISGTLGQVVGFNSSGEVIAQDALVTATSTDGKTYTATVANMPSLVVGKEITIVPDCTTTVVNPTLNVNGLGAKYLRCALTGNNTTTVASANAAWIYSGKPVKIRYNGSFWVTDIFRTDCNTLYGTTAIANGGTGATTAEAARANLGVVNPDWEQTDETQPDGIKNKPFGDYPTGGDTITWDGDTEGRASLANILYKVSDLIPTMDEISNGVTIYKYDQAPVSFGSDSIQEPAPGLVVVNEYDMWVIPESLVGVDLGGGVAASESGIYVGYAGSMQYVNRITINGYTGFPYTKKMDEKYMPYERDRFVIRFVYESFNSETDKTTYTNETNGRDASIAFEAGRQVVALFIEDDGMVSRQLPAVAYLSCDFYFLNIYGSSDTAVDVICWGRDQTDITI